MDLNHDGYPDLLSGSWPGEIFLFKGKENHAFAAPEMIRDREGHIINIGGGIEEREDGSLRVTGSGEFEETEEGRFVVYRGERS